MPKFAIDGDLVRQLAALLDETGLGEIEYEADGRRLRVAKPASAAPSAVMAPAPVAAAPAAAAPASAAPGADPQAHPGAVKSPMVGTVYLSPTPEEPPFAQAGQPVEAGQTIMLVEAMKTFNDIKAPKSGTLRSILVENGQPVEYDEILAIVE